MAATNPFDPTSSKSNSNTGGATPGTSVTPSGAGVTATTDTGMSKPLPVARGSAAGSDVSGVQAPAAAVVEPANSGLLSNAMNNPVTPTGTAGNVASATAGNASGTGYDSTSAANTQRVVTDPQLVSGQLAKDMDPSSLLMQKSQADAAQTANGRGLLNSAMAAGAGTGALLDRALQIATPDAATNATASSENTASLNQNAEFNSGQTNAAAAAKAAATNAADLQNATANTQVSEQNASSKNAATQFDAAQSLQAQTANQSAAVATATTAFNAAAQNALQNASEADKITTQKMVSDTQVAIEKLDAQYKTQMQTSQSAQGMYSSTMTAIGGIMQDPNLDAAGKQQLVDQQMAALTNGLNVQMGISNITGVASLVSNLGSGVTTTAANNPVAMPTASQQSGDPTAPGYVAPPGPANPGDTGGAGGGGGGGGTG